jgi:ribosome-binding factor A
MISITDVEVSADLKYARIYFSRLGSEEERQRSLHALRHATAFLRRLLAPRLTIRSVPEIEFRLDPSLAHGERVTRLLNQLPELKQPAPSSSPPADQRPPE